MTYEIDITQNVQHFEVELYAIKWRGVIDEAPTDGKEYVRENGAWVEIALGNKYIIETGETINIKQDYEYIVSNLISEGTIENEGIITVGNGIDIPDNVVIDDNYVHTDNNLTDELVNTIESALQTEIDPVWNSEKTNYYTKTEVETNFRNETQDTIGDLIETTELETVIDNTKIAVSDSAFLKFVKAITFYNFIKPKLDLIFQPLKSSLELYVSQTEKDVWNGKQSALGFTPENVINKKLDLSDNSDTFYPTQKAVKTAVDAKQNTLTFSTDIESDKASTTKISAISYLYNFFGKLSTVNVWALLQTFQTGIKSALFQDLFGNNPFVSQNGGTIYSATKWFIPASGQTLTVSSDGLTVTLANPVTNFQFINTMPLSKITVSGYERIINTYTSASVITLTTALPSTLFSQTIAYTDWAIYLRRISEDVLGGTAFSSKYGTSDKFSSGGDWSLSSGYLGNSNTVNFLGGILGFGSALQMGWSSTTASSGTKDTGLARIAAGVLQIYDGLTSGTYRDLILRNINKTGYDYFAVSATADTLNDRRTSVVSGVQIDEICTVANAAKGGGTWVITTIDRKIKALTNNVSVNLIDINVAAGTMQVVRIEYSMVAKDAGGNVRSHFGYMTANLRNQGGSITSNITHAAQLENDLGTITDTYAITNGTNKGTLTLTANASGMTTTTFDIYMNIISQGSNNITLL